MRANYSIREIRDLVENYEAYVYRKDRLWVLVKLADLDRSIKRLPLEERRAVVVYGLLRIPARLAGDILNCNKNTVLRRYENGMRSLYLLINGR